MGHHPGAEGLRRAVQVRRPDFVLVSTLDLKEFTAIVQALESLCPGLLVVGFGAENSVEVLTALMHLGIRVHLTTPITTNDLRDAVRTVESHSKRFPAPSLLRADLYSFLPAKGGVGASTLAVAVSGVLATQWNLKTLLIDGDLSAGTIQFQLKLTNNTSILHAVRRSRELDESLWLDLVAQQGNLDILHAGGSDYYPILESADVHEVIQLARSQYSVVCVDLGHNLSPFTAEFLRESRQIFLVTTCELSCVHWAAVRMARFKELGIADRVTVLLNRQPSHRALLSPEEVAGILDHRPQLCFHEDRKTVDQATLDGESIRPNTPLGGAIFDLAKSLVPAQP
jgi:pilus assembly protein CpaE